MSSKLCIPLFAAACALSPGPCRAGDGTFQPHYEVINLGSLGGADSAAFGINDAGTVVGWSSTATGHRHAFMYNNGFMTDLGTLVGGTASEAHAINDLDVIVGSSEINGVGRGFPEIHQGFIWEQGKMSPAGALFCPCSFNVRYGTSSLNGINDAGQAVGWSGTVRGSLVAHGALWQAEVLQDLGGGAGDWSISHIYAINDSGQMVGDYAQDAGKLGVLTFDREATLWQSDGTRQSLGFLPGDTTSVALAINAGGSAVGWSGSSDGLRAHAVLWRGGSIRDLGVLPGYANSQALAINFQGQVVGWSGSADGSLSHAFLWLGGRMLDLNELVQDGSGWVLQQAAGINMLGQIVGTGMLNGQKCAYLLQPVFVWGFPARRPLQSMLAPGREH